MASRYIDRAVERYILDHTFPPMALQVEVELRGFQREDVMESLARLERDGRIEQVPYVHNTRISGYRIPSFWRRLFLTVTSASPSAALD